MRKCPLKVWPKRWGRFRYAKSGENEFVREWEYIPFGENSIWKSLGVFKEGQDDPAARVVS